MALHLEDVGWKQRSSQVQRSSPRRRTSRPPVPEKKNYRTAASSQKAARKQMTDDEVGERKRIPNKKQDHNALSSRDPRDHVEDG